MKIISHRGNIRGPIPEKENRPSYIDCAIQLGFDVEIDLRFENGNFWLGHDKSDYVVNEEWILRRKDFLWVHCKNLEASCQIQDVAYDIKFFCHSQDSYVLISNGYLWVHDLNLRLSDKCVIPLIDKCAIEQYSNKIVYAVCTDYTNLI